MQPPTLLITATMLRWAARCDRRIWLDAHHDLGLRDTPTPFLQAQLDYGNQHEAQVHEATTPSATLVAVESWEEGVEQTRSLMAQGSKVIIGACLEVIVELEGIAQPVTVRGKVDRLKRVDLDSPETSFIYAPIEIKSHQQLDREDLLQLDCYVWLLSQLQGVEPPAAFWLGHAADGSPLHRQRHQYHKPRFLRLLQKVAELLNPETSAPSVNIMSHCRQCHWYSSCHRVARDTFSVTLLSGLHKHTRRHFQEVGIHVLTQIAEMDVDALQQFSNIGPKTAPAFKAQAQAYLENRPVWYGQLPEACQEQGWFFDIETKGSQGEVWSIGWCWQEDAIQNVIVVPEVAPQIITLPNGSEIILVPTMTDAWLRFSEAVSDNNDPIYHWTSFDASNMRKFAPDVYERLRPRLHDLYSSFKRRVQLPEHSTSLKNVAPFAGFSWQGYQDWWPAYQDYRKYLKTLNLDHLTNACAYQADDVKAMVAVWRWLNRNGV